MGSMYRAPVPANRKFKRAKLPNASKGVDRQQNKVIKNLQKKVAKIDNGVELKHIDTEMTNVEFAQATAAAQLQLCNGIAQGITNLLRVGDDINMTSFQIRGVVSRNILELANQSCRLMLIYDKAPKGTAITFGEVLQANTLGTASNIVFAPYNTDYVGTRIKILWDKLIQLNPQTPDAWNVTTVAPPGVDAAAVSGYAPQQMLIKKKIKLNKKTIFGLGTGATIADISVGSLYLMFIGTELVAGDNATFSGVARVIFRDP